MQKYINEIPCHLQKASQIDIRCNETFVNCTFQFTEQNAIEQFFLQVSQFRKQDM